ncbi:uncharacterized protein [Aquarana catesbeiana]|uniref:uncharacterized protein n=1 Tax=Aquarana catesbeiana TaxID=8400 RepID=UPI003CC96DD9
MKNLCMVLLFLHTDGLLYPYGHSTDNVTPKSDDGVSPPILATVPLFGKIYSSIYVNNNGLLSFDAELGSSAPQHLPIATRGPFLAPFWTDVNNEISGNIYYHLSNDLELLNMTKNDTSRYFPTLLFSPKWVFVATWDKVSYYNSKTNKVNTFQVVLSTDETSTFFMFNYGDIQWPTGKDNEGPPALAGCNSGFSEGYFEIPGSLTPGMINITHTSNVDLPGHWVFKVDRVEVESPTMNIDSTTSPTPTKTYFTSQKMTDLPSTNYTTHNTKVTSPSLSSSTSATTKTMQNTTVTATRVHDSTSPIPTKTYITSQNVTDLPSTNYTTHNTKVTSPSLGSSSAATAITGQNITVVPTRVHDSTTSPLPTKTYFTSQKVTDLPSTNYTTHNTKVTSPSLGLSTSATTIQPVQNTTVVPTRVHGVTTTPSPAKTYFTSPKATDPPLTIHNTFETKVTSPSPGSSTSPPATTVQNTTLCTTNKNDGPLYAYGNSTDQVTNHGVSLSLPATVPLFEKNYSTIYVNNNGFVSFEKELGNNSMLNVRIATVEPFLAPFQTDVKKEISGDIYYRLSNDSELLKMLGENISSYFPEVTFSPDWVFVATWDKVSYFGSKTNKTNTFQAVLGTDGNLTFIMFNYGDIQWPTENEGPLALAGYNSGFAGGFFIIPGSFNASIINITHTSNVNFPGRWVFRVDQVEIGPPTMNPGQQNFYPVVVYAPILGCLLLVMVIILLLLRGSKRRYAVTPYTNVPSTTTRGG